MPRPELVEGLAWPQALPDLDLQHLRPQRAGHGEATPFGEGDRIEEAQRRGSVAHDQRRVVVREAPPFAAVVERPLRRERFAVVDEADVRLPRQLDQLRLPDGDPLTEILAGD